MGCAFGWRCEEGMFCVLWRELSGVICDTLDKAAFLALKDVITLGVNPDRGYRAP